MKHKLILITIGLLLVLSGLILSAGILLPPEFFSNEGDTETVNVSRGIYDEITIREVVNFEDYVYLENLTFYHANYTITGVNGSSKGDYHSRDKFNRVNIESRYNVVLSNIVEWKGYKVISRIDNSKKGNPIYEDKEIIGIVYGAKTYNFDEKGCWVCGNLIACLDKKDGYSMYRGDKYKCDEANYPIILSSEKGWIKNLDTKEILFDNTNGELK